MTEIMFYHAVESDAHDVLFTLLKKSLEAQKRSLVRVANAQIASELSEILWAYRDDYLLPHGLCSEKMSDQQPVLITHQNNNMNQSDYIFFYLDADIIDFEDYSRVIVIFDDRSQSVKQTIRTQWKTLKDKGYDVTYYKQADGRWVKSG